MAFGLHYGLTVATCVPHGPASKGGSESTVKIAKADLVPAQANLLGDHASFAELEEVCEGFCQLVNARPHRITRRAPAEMLAEERARLHPVPASFTAALGVTRKADTLSQVAFEGGQYSVPHQLAGQAVWARRHGGQLVITHAGAADPVEVARHLVTTPGSPRVDDSHYPPAPPGAVNRTAKPRTTAEAGFLAIGNGAGLWLAEATATGATRVAAAVQLAALHGAAAADRVAHQASAVGGEPSQADEQSSLAQGTAGCAAHRGTEVGP